MDSPSAPPLVIATRESRLALWQAHHVQARLQAGGHAVRILGMTTRGDQILDRSLAKVGGKGLFVKELETALARGEADLAVHSLKDVPMQLPEGFALACVLEREDPRDAWVSPRCAGLAELPRGGVVGTSSLRRGVQLRDALQRLGRDDVRILPVRGNVDTRLRKLDEGQFDALLLAAAGLLRLGLSERIRHSFAIEDMLPAAGQGAMAVEVRAGRAALEQALQPLADRRSWLAVAAERAVSLALGGSCSVPLAAHAVWQGDGELLLRARWSSVRDEAQIRATALTAPLVQAQAQAPVRTLAEAQALGERVAAALCAAGAVRNDGAADAQA